MATALLLVGGCHAADPAPVAENSPGDRLERAALDRGLVTAPGRTDPVGLYARDGDRACVVTSGSAFRLGVLVRYDDGPGCEATGTARRVATGLAVHLDEACQFNVAIEGDRIVFPAMLPPGCERFCSGRASMAALAGDRLSSANAEAVALRDPRGRPMCGS